MQVVKESLSPCQVSLQISVEPDKVAQAVDKAYKEFSKHVQVPGFRKGHAPLSFVKPRIPQENLRERTAELLVESAYREAVEQEGLQPFAAPELELLAIETNVQPYKFEFKAAVALPPHVELGEYKAVPVERETFAITDEGVDQRIEQIRERAAEYPIVEGRAAQAGDILVTDLTITPDGATEAPAARSTVINLGDADNVPGLDEQLIGLSKGDDKAFRLRYPNDYPSPEAAGQEAGFFVVVNEIHERKLPVLDDEFAKKFGGVDTLAEFKTKVHQELEQGMQEMAGSVVETRLIDSVVEKSVIDYPIVILNSEVQAEVTELLEDLKRRQIDIQDYLTSSGKTEEALLEDFQKQADRRIRRGLALGEIARAESITVETADIDAEIEDRAAKNRTSPEAMRAYIDAQNQNDQIARTVITKKVLGFLISNAIITERVLTASELAGEPITADASAGNETPDAAEPKPKAKRAPKKKTEDA